VSIGFYMDHHVNEAITVGLRGRGVDCLMCEEDGTKELDDQLLLARSTALRRVLFSQDIDLLNIASRWMREGKLFAGLVYARQRGLGIGRAIDDLELIAVAVTPE